MAMNFELDLLPTASGTYSLGSSDKKWNLYASAISGVRTTASFSITTSNWSGSGPYTYTLSNTSATANSSISVDLGDTFAYLNKPLKVEPSAGKLTFSTATKPSNTISGTLEIVNLG